MHVVHGWVRRRGSCIQLILCRIDMPAGDAAYWQGGVLTVSTWTIKFVCTATLHDLHCAPLVRPVCFAVLSPDGGGKMMLWTRHVPGSSVNLA